MAATDAEARQIRSSSLLLSGRFISLAVGFLAQVIVVRYLEKGDYGAFAYALSVISLAATIAAFGLEKATSRFLPIFDERGDRGRGLGVILLGVGVMTFIGLAIVAAMYAAPDLLAAGADPTSVGVLLVMIPLVPVQALNPMMTSTLAALSHPRAIFVRRYLVEPALELIVIAVVVLSAASVIGLAYGYLLAGLLGLVIYGAVVARILRNAGYLTGDALRRLTIPAREVFTFSLPLLSSNLVFVLRGAVVVILLEAFGTAVDVADFRSVFPQARLNMVVIQNFTFLFLPLAARLYERRDLPGLRALHGRTSVWVVLMSYVPFAASFALATPLISLLYGERYASSALILAILSVGFFVSAGLGLAGLSLRVAGSARFLMGIELATAIGALAVYFVLIPAYGALGAAIGTTLTLIAQALAYHYGAVRAGGADVGWSSLLRLMGECVGLATLVGVVQVMLGPPLWLGLALVGGTWAILLWAHRESLDVGNIFPEIVRIPVIGRLFTGQARAGRGSQGPGSDDSA